MLTTATLTHFLPATNNVSSRLQALRRCDWDEALLLDAFADVAAASASILWESAEGDTATQLHAFVGRVLALDEAIEDTVEDDGLSVGDAVALAWVALAATTNVYATNLHITAQPHTQRATQQWGEVLAPYLQYAPTWQQTPPQPPPDAAPNELLDALLDTHHNQVMEAVEHNQHNPTALLQHLITATQTTAQTVTERENKGSGGVDAALGWEMVVEAASVYAEALGVVEGRSAAAQQRASGRYLKWAAVGAALVGGSVLLQVLLP